MLVYIYNSIIVYLTKVPICYSILLYDEFCCMVSKKDFIGPNLKLWFTELKGSKKYRDKSGNCLYKTLCFSGKCFYIYFLLYYLLSTTNLNNKVLINCNERLIEKTRQKYFAWTYQRKSSVGSCCIASIRFPIQMPQTY